MRGRLLGGSAGGRLAAVGVAALAVICCATLPLLAALLGSFALGSVLGLGAAVAAALGVLALVLVRARRQQAGELPDQNCADQADARAPERPPERVT